MDQAALKPGQDGDFYLKQITDYLAVNGEASRTEINQRLLGKLSEALTDEQKYTKVSNLLGKLRRRKVIVNEGSDTAPRWLLTPSNQRLPRKMRGLPRGFRNMINQFNELACVGSARMPRDCRREPAHLWSLKHVLRSTSRFVALADSTSSGAR